MNPISPVMPNKELQETVWAKDQSPYIPLPSFTTDDGYVLSRWRLTWRERLQILWNGDIYHWQGTFGDRLQPISMHVEPPKVK